MKKTKTQEELAYQFRTLADLVEEDPLDMCEEAMRAILACLTVLTSKHYQTDMSIEQVARYFGVTTRTINRWQKDLGFPEGKRIGYHESSFHIQEIVAWKKANEHLLNNKRRATI